MSIYRMQSGLIFDDSFETLDPRWLVSPSDSFTLDGTTEQLVMDHNNSDRSTHALFTLPADEDVILMQVHADYTPTQIGDEGGIVVWKNALEKVEFLESEDNTQAGEYSVWRAIKRHNLWTFFAERNSAWELFDSTICLDPIMAGVVLKGRPRNGYVPLAVDRVILCRGSHISVGNVEGTQKVELIDEWGQVVSAQIVPDGYAGIDLELPTIPFKGKVKVFEDDGQGTYVVIDEQGDFTDMYGGDVFMSGTDLKVTWKGKELSEMAPTHIGSLKNNELELQMKVLNDNEGKVAENVEIRIAAYFDEYGWEWCDIAEDIQGSPGTYQDTAIPIGTLMPGDSKDFWVKIVRAAMENTNQVRPTHFYLEVYND